MAIYRYPHESLVDSVHLLTNEKGGMRAYLYADDGKDSEKLRLLKQALRGQGYKCVPTLNEDKPVLEVRGFKKPEELMGFLGGMRAVKGAPEIIGEAGDTRTNKEKLQNGTLKLAGLSYNVGDAFYMWYTLEPLVKKEAGKLAFKKPGFTEIFDIVAGVGYAMGSFCLTFFGSKDQSINTITAATSKVERFARTQGYEISPESSIAFVNQDPKRNAWESLNHTISRFPSESLNSIYVGVGFFLSAAAFHRAGLPKETFQSFKELKAAEEFLNKTKTSLSSAVEHEKAESDLLKAQRKYGADVDTQNADKTDVGLGIVTAASAITGLLVKEQKRLDGDPKRHGIGGIIDWVREKPLRVTGYGYMLATGFHAKATYDKWVATSALELAEKTIERSKLKKRAVFIAANVVSEILLAISSKGHGVGVKPDASINDSVISTAAELVLRQPQDKREAVISQLSGYIASPEVLAIKAEDVEKSIRQHIAALDKNPWTKHYIPTANGQMVEAAPTAPAVPVPVPEVTAKPTSTVSNAEYVSKHQALEHALA